jgi:hypothetical protein
MADKPLGLSAFVFAGGSIFRIQAELRAQRLAINS